MHLICELSFDTLEVESINNVLAFIFVQRPLEFMFLKAKLEILCSDGYKDNDNMRTLLRSVCFRLDQNAPTNMDDFISLNVPNLHEILIDCAQNFLRRDQVCSFLHVYSHKFEDVDELFDHEIASECLKLLKIMKDSFPCDLDSMIVTAKVHFVCGMKDAAYDDILKCLDNYPHNPFVHLCAARLYLYRGRLKETMAYLDNSLSMDFSVQETLLFKVIKGECLLKMKSNLSEARDFVRDACLHVINPEHHHYYNWEDVDDLFRCHLLLSMLMTDMDDKREIQSIVQRSKEQFPKEKDRILILQSEIAILQYSYEEALNVLAKFDKVRENTADLYIVFIRSLDLTSLCNSKYKNDIGQ